MDSNGPQVAPKKSGMSSDHVLTFYTSVLRSLRSGLEKPDFSKSKWGLLETFGDFWGLKIMGTRGQLVDVIHHLSPKVPIIFLRYITLDVEIYLRYAAR